MEEKLKAKKLLSELIIDILSEKISVEEAVKRFPRGIKDESINCAIHALLHYEADEDYRKYHPDYLEEQREYLEYIANLFRQGEDFPVNIIEEYKKYYETAPIVTKKGIINTLKNLFRLTT